MPWFNTRKQDLHTIGVLKVSGDPNFQYLEWLYKKTLWKILVWDWKDMQSKSDPATTAKRVKAKKRKSRRP